MITFNQGIRMHRLRFHPRMAWLALLLVFAQHAWARPLMIGAASSLEESVREITAAFQKLHPDVAIAFNFAGSHVLARQIEAGAPIDILLSADQTLLEKLRQKKLLAARPDTELFSNRLVVITPAGARFIPKSPEDFKRAEIKTIALGDPNVPVGKYAAAYLEKAGIMPELKSKITTSENVRATLTLVSKGRADVGIVYRTDVAIAQPPPHIAWEVAPGETPPIVYAGAATKSCATPQLCQDYLEHLASPGAQRVFAKAGFTPLADKS